MDGPMRNGVFFVVGLLASVLVGTCLATSASLLSGCASHSMDLQIPSTCSEYVRCRTAYCSCVGGCERPLSVCDSAKGRCFSTFLECLARIAGNRTSSEASCASLGQSLYVSELAAIAGGWETSRLKRNCAALTCNATLIGSP